MRDSPKTSVENANPHTPKRIIGRRPYLSVVGVNDDLSDRTNPEDAHRTHAPKRRLLLADTQQMHSPRRHQPQALTSKTFKVTYNEAAVKANVSWIFGRTEVHHHFIYVGKNLGKI